MAAQDARRIGRQSRPLKEAIDFAVAGETKAPARSVTRSVFIAAPVIALMFMLGTSTVVAYVPNNDIDLIGPVAQVLEHAASGRVRQGQERFLVSHN